MRLGFQSDPHQDGPQFILGHIVDGHRRADVDGNDEVQTSVHHFLVAANGLEHLGD